MRVQDRDTIPIVLTVTAEFQAGDGMLYSMRWLRSAGSEGLTLSIQKVSTAHRIGLLADLRSARSFWHICQILICKSAACLYDEALDR